MWPEVWLKEKQHWAKDNPKLDNTRTLRGIYYIEQEDIEFKGTMRNARNKLELHVVSAMLCKWQKTSVTPSLKPLEGHTTETCDEHFQGKIFSQTTRRETQLFVHA